VPKDLPPEPVPPPFDREAQSREEAAERLRQDARGRAVERIVFVAPDKGLWSLEVSNQGTLVVTTVTL